MNNYNKYIELLKANKIEVLHEWVKTLSRGEKVFLIETLEANGKPVLRALAYNYETQKWVV